MKGTRVAAVGLILCVAQAAGRSSAASAGEQQSARWTFDEDVIGQLPPAWSARQTRPTSALATWQVVADSTAPSEPHVLALTRTENQSRTFNLAVAENTSFQNVDLTVMVKGVRGEVDQGGGPIWRCQDEDNYYICRFNPLEGNYRVYKVEEGRRRQLESAEVETDAGRWYAVRVTMVGERITCYLDGTKHLEVTDGTFPHAGKVGLWTKADAATSFDDLAVREVTAPEETTAARLYAAAIGKAAGAQATPTPDGVVRIGWPRTDVSLSVDGMPFKPFAGLGSWAAFKATPHGAMVMGDTVVFQDEVTPAMDAAFANGLEVSALHNHFFFDEPKVYFMHIGGHGEPEKLAAGVKAVWDAIKRVRAEQPMPATRYSGGVPAAGAIDAARIEDLIGHKAQTKDGVVKVIIGREGSMHSVPIGASMGLTTWAAFSGSNAFAAVDGDFIMTADEVQPVLRALRAAGIHVVALHNHMIGEHPTFYFTHFWGKGSAEKLAQGIRAALDAQEQASTSGRSQ